MRRRCGPAPGADLIGREFGIQYHAGHVWKLLRQLGWSPQRPAGRALERNEEAIGEWKRRTWPAIKKSRKRRAHHRLHRRKRVKPASPPVSHLGAARADTGAPVPLQLENHFRCSRDDALELLFPDLRQSRGQGRDDHLPVSPPSPLEITLAGGLGQTACPPEPVGRRVPRFARRSDRGRLSSALCPGAESRRISLGLLETPPATECLCKRSLASQR